MCLLELEYAKKAAEKQIGIEIPDVVAKKVFDYSVRKCEVNGKGDGYLPLLYQNELQDYYMRIAINEKGACAYV